MKTFCFHFTRRRVQLLSIIPAHTTAAVDWSRKVRRKIKILERIVFIQVLLNINSTELYSRSFLIHWLAEAAATVRIVLFRVLASVDWTAWNVHRALCTVFIISTTYSCRCCSSKILQNSNSLHPPWSRGFYNINSCLFAYSIKNYVELSNFLGAGLHVFHHASDTEHRRCMQYQQHRVIFCTIIRSSVIWLTEIIGFSRTPSFPSFSATILNEKLPTRHK